MIEVLQFIRPNLDVRSYNYMKSFILALCCISQTDSESIVSNETEFVPDGQTYVFPHTGQL